MEYRFDLEKFIEGEFIKAEWQAQIQEMTGLGKSKNNRTINNYRDNSAFVNILDGERVLMRRFETIGNDATGGNEKDMWGNNVSIKETDIARCSVSVFFPKGFCKKTRAGKLPLNLRSKEGVALGKINWQGFESMVMFHTDIDEDGNVIPPKKLDPERTKFSIKSYTYAQSLDQKGTYGAKGGHWKDISGKVILIEEGQWVDIEQFVSLNDYGESNGYISPSLWIGGFKKMAFTPDRDGLTFRRKENPFNITVWGNHWFMGGGDNSFVPHGYKPTEPVEVYAKNFYCVSYPDHVEQVEDDLDGVLDPPLHPDEVLIYNLNIRVKELEAEVITLSNLNGEKNEKLQALRVHLKPGWEAYEIIK